ncbi:MAG: UDP-N-acetylmuramate dehydrogenase [Maricaulaceae bacterium]
MGQRLARSACGLRWGGRAVSDLIDRLPAVRGRLIANADLSAVTWLRVGGPADVMFIPADEADLANFLADTPDEIPVMVMGVGSNLLVRDGGIAGVVVRLGPRVNAIPTEGTRITAGAATLDASLAKAAQKAGLAGLEFFVGVPGTVGGAVRMNAGCYGGETKDVLVSATAIDRAGRRIRTGPEELGHSYRACAAPADWIFVEATFEGCADAPEAIAERTAAITEKREQSQPIREKTGGSTFKNPDPQRSGGRKTWELIDAAGGRGRRLGGAQISPQHCNFLINTGDATAADLETLAEGVRADVAQATGVDLAWEIKRVGRS